MVTLNEVMLNNLRVIRQRLEEKAQVEQELAKGETPEAKYPEQDN